MKKGNLLILGAAVMILFASCGSKGNHTSVTEHKNKDSEYISTEDISGQDTDAMGRDAENNNQSSDQTDSTSQSTETSDSNYKQPALAKPLLVRTTLAETWKEAAEIVAVIRILENLGADKGHTIFRAEIMKAYKGEPVSNEIYFLQGGNADWQYEGFPLFKIGDEILVGLAEYHEGERFEFTYPETVDRDSRVTFFGRNCITTWMRRMDIDGQTYFYRNDYTYTMTDVEKTYSNDEILGLMKQSGCFSETALDKYEKQVNETDFNQRHRFVSEAWLVELLRKE